MSILANDVFADLDRLRLPTMPTVGRPETTPKAPPPSLKLGRIKGEFLKGPIPLPWLAVASKLPGKAPLAVALAVWFEAGRRKSKEVRLTTAILKRFNVNRNAKSTALKSLETAGLIRVCREPRRNPVVTILDLDGGPDVEGSRPDDNSHGLPVPGTTT
jgi:hypothetical protein